MQILLCLSLLINAAGLIGFLLIRESEANARVIAYWIMAYARAHEEIRRAKVSIWREAREYRISATNPKHPYVSDR